MKPEILAALEWADLLGRCESRKLGPALLDAKQHATVLAREYRKLLDTDYLDEALNSGDGTYKP